MSGPSVGSHQPRPSRILIVDDHELARGGLHSMLSGEPDLEVVGEAENGERAVKLSERLMPDLVLMDVRMPGMDGIAATAAIKRFSPGTSVLMVTLYLDHDYLFQAIKAGAAGYVLKDATRRELLTSVRRVLEGETALDSALAMKLLSRLSREKEERVAQSIDPLTPRELQVLRLVVEGQTNHEIAGALSIGSGTVKSHVEHIIAKLGAADRTQAAVRAVQLGLLRPDRQARHNDSDGWAIPSV